MPSHLARAFAIIAVLPCLLPDWSRLAADEPYLRFDTAAIESAVERVMKDRDVPGCVVGVVVGDKLEYAKPFGVANVDKESPMKLDTRFQIGSVTKTFTAALACVLRDRGLLDLHDPIAKFLPSNARVPTHSHGRPITIFHLATHTSGLPANPINRRNVPDTPSVMEPYSVDELYEALARTELATPPGQNWNYSNFGYGLLGHVLERAASKQYEELLRNHIFEPLGMDDSHITITDGDRIRMASHCWPADSPRVARRPWVFGEVCAFGGIISTLPDLAKYVSLQFRAHDPPKPFTAAGALEWQMPRHIINPRTWRYGMALGWWLHRHEEFGNLLAHGGEVDGHSASMAISTDAGVGIVVLSIVGADTADLIGREVLPFVMRPALEQLSKLETHHEAEDWNKLYDVSKSIVQRHPQQARAQYELGYAALLMGKLEEGARASRRAAQLGFRTPNSYYNAACGYARQKDKDAAFTCLQKAVATGFRDLQFAASDPDLQSLRDDPRWDKLMQRQEPTDDSSP